MWRSIAITLALVTLTSTAAAQGPQDLPLLDPVPPQEWYGLPVVLADAVTAATLMIGWAAGVNREDRFGVVLDVAMVGYLSVGPAFHFAHGEPAGLASLGLRAGAVVGGTVEIWSIGMRGLVLAAVTAIDAALLAWNDLPFVDVALTADGGAAVQTGGRW